MVLFQDCTRYSWLAIATLVIRQLHVINQGIATYVAYIAHVHCMLQLYVYIRSYICMYIWCRTVKIIIWYSSTMNSFKESGFYWTQVIDKSCLQYAELYYVSNQNYPNIYFSSCTYLCYDNHISLCHFALPQDMQHTLQFITLIKLK